MEPNNITDLRSLLLAGGKSGLKGVTRLILNVFLFGLSNLVLVVYGILKASAPNSSTWILLMVVLGIVFTLYVGYRSYRYVVIYGISGVYSGLGEPMNTLCARLVDQYANRTQGKGLQTQELVNNVFGALPGFLRKVLSFLLGRLPLKEILQSINADISSGNHTEAQRKLHLELDTRIQGFFTENNTKWVLWLLPLNIVIQLGIVFAKLV